MAIVAMVNNIKKYDWGSVSEIPRLTGIENTGGEPMAELWIGAHAGAPSKVRRDGLLIPLSEFISREPDRVLGAVVTRHFGERLPFLLKFCRLHAPSPYRPTRTFLKLEKVSLARTPRASPATRSSVHTETTTTSPS